MLQRRRRSLRAELLTAMSDHQTRESPAVPSSPGDGLPVFRRAAPEDALDYAQAAFVSGDRLELGTLADRLSIGRTTLYRWFGTREQLLERVLVRLTRQFSTAAQAELKLDGIDRVLEFTRHMINATIGFEPAQVFVNREPQLALRLLIGEHGAVHHAIVEEILAILAQAGPVANMSGLEDRINVAVQVGTALQWATFAIGDQPDPQRVLDIVQILIAGH
jgi:AcrR family transcriptional regulator